MIIKKVNIIAFGALKNKVIQFDKGINIIYGENETGKSTIESFIKIWLYGFSSSRVKDLKSNERMRHSPISGENMRGELYVEFNNKEYIISRSFGKTKKEDTATVLDAQTGEVVDYISVDEPGKYFLGINRSTFIKTLFIGQLDVNVKKDKEEEIVDKISAMVGISEGDVSIDKAILKLEAYKKSIKNVRKSGTLDNNKNVYSELVNERYEGYSLSEHNIENEERLIALKDEKKSINIELDNLDIYKKYLKRIKLQKEYEEISQYLKKQEELKKKGRFIEEELTYNNESISAEFINDIKEENSLYLSLLDLKNEDTLKLNKKKEELEILKEPIKNCDYIGALGEDLSQNLMTLKIEQIALKEKVDLNKIIDREVAELKQREEETKGHIGKAIKIESVRDEVKEDLGKYEEVLKELKYLFDIDISSKNNTRIFKIISIIFAIASVIFSIIVKGIAFKLLFIVIAIALVSIAFSINKIKSFEKNSRIKLLKNEVNRLEMKLDTYNAVVEVKDYGQLIKSLKLFDEYISIKDKINIKIEEKLSQKQLLALEQARDKYLKNEKVIEEYRKVSGLATLEELMAEVNNYERVQKSFNNLEIDIKNSEEAIKRVGEQLEIREERIREKLRSIGLGDIDLLDLESKLVALREKIMQKEEISRSLKAIEETYSVLAKDKDIEAIKNDLKDIINITFKYSYNTDEEIDNAVKEKSNRLITVEKEIKDVENEIANRFKGKRNLPEIEEELEAIEGKIKEDEQNFKASELAIELLKDSYEEIRGSFGPILNKKVIDNFKNFSNNKYNDVMVSDKYEMKVVQNGEIFSAELLSNGANDQLYLSLRLAFIEMIFKNKDITIYLDDAFVQYDDERLKKTLGFIYFQDFVQCLIFTCQKREEQILKELRFKHSIIELKS